MSLGKNSTGLITYLFENFGEMEQQKKKKKIEIEVMITGHSPNLMKTLKPRSTVYSPKG